MIDIKLLRERPELFKEGARKKGVKIDIDQALRLDRELRSLRFELDNLRRQRKEVSRKVSFAGKEQDEKTISWARKIKAQVKELESRESKIQAELKEILSFVPLPPAPDVPEGKSEDDNVVVKTWGKIPTFNFPPKDYITLMRQLDLLDLERGVKIGGFRGYVLKNEAVLLENALLRYSIDFLTRKGFTLLRPPIMVREFALFGTGMFPEGKKDTYKVDDDLFLAGTTEVPLMALHAGEILSEKDLPIRYVGLSPAYRREVGSYGKDLKGVFRVHEFIQTEMVVLCKNDIEESIRWHEKLLSNSEEMMQELGLPYRVVNVCAGELSSGQAKRYDIEAWVPSEKRFRETHSDSYLLDFQSRRLNIRYRTDDGKLNFVHSLNNTGIAVPRILISLIENYQREDGSIKIPDVLRPYVGLEEIKR